MSDYWIDVTEAPYSAVGDGTTDDTTAIQTAIDAAGDNGVVFFPNKTFKTSGTLTAAYNNHTWLMYGATIWADFDGIAVRFGSFDASHENNSVYGGSIVRTDSLNSTDWTEGNIGWQWLNISRYQHLDYYIRGFEIGQQLLGEGQDSGTTTISIASPAVVSKTAHGLNDDDIVYFTTTGALPTGVSADVAYYVEKIDANTFNISLTSSTSMTGFVPITTTGTQSGTHTLWKGLTIGVQYGHLVPRHIISNKFGISCTCRNGGWCNENAFFGAGRVGNVSGDGDQSGAYMISLQRDVRTPHVLNNNKFYGLSLENGKLSNKPKAVLCDAAFCLFDFCRFEGFDPEFIQTGGAGTKNDFQNGGNAFRGGIGLVTPETSLTHPTNGSYLFEGSRASVWGGGSPTERALAVRDRNNANNYSFAVQDTSGTDWFKVNGVGVTQIGDGSSLTAKLGIFNNVTSQKGIVLKQPASATVPAIEVLNSSGDPVFAVQKNTNGAATEAEVTVIVGDLGNRISLTEEPFSAVLARGQLGGLAAYSTTEGAPGVLVLGNDDGVVANSPKELAYIAVGGNSSSSSNDSPVLITVYADGPWENDPDVITPTRTVFRNGSATDTPLDPYLEANSAGEIGFFGATPVGRPEVDGSTDSNVALENLLAALHNLGLITNAT